MPNGTGESGVLVCASALVFETYPNEVLVFTYDLYACDKYIPHLIYGMQSLSLHMSLFFLLFGLDCIRVSRAQRTSKYNIRKPSPVYLTYNRTSVP